MSVIYILLTVLMFLDCVLLVFLVLLQLPKKEAGAGMAFGGAATDALFGAGSGNVLTKITKYVAGVFFALAILMALIAARKPESSAVSLAKKLTQGSAGTTVSSAPAQPPAATPPAGGGLLPQLSNAAPVAPSTASTVKTNK